MPKTKEFPDQSIFLVPGIALIKKQVVYHLSFSLLNRQMPSKQVYPSKFVAEFEVIA
jgi:hypothetical protein